MYRSAAAFLLIAIATSPSTAQKKPSTGSSNPELAYLYSGSKSVQFRLANEDLTGSSTLHTFSGRMMPRFDLAARGQRQIALAHGQQLLLWTYEPTTTGVKLASAVTLPTGSDKVYDVSFSRDGTKIAFFAVDASSAGQIRVYDLTAAPGSAISDLGIVNWATDLEWYADGSAIVYVDSPGTGYIVREKRLDGSDVELFREANVESIDVSREVGNREILVSYSRPDGGPIYIGTWANGDYVNETLSTGTDPHYKCDGSRVVHRAFQRTNQPTYIYNVSNGSESLLTKDANVRRVDYMPTC